MSSIEVFPIKLFTVNLCWPQMTSTKNNGDQLLTMMITHTKYELNWSFPCQVIHCLTSVDLRWPLTSTKNNRDRLLTMMNKHTKYGLNWSFLHEVMVITRFSLFDLCRPQVTFDFDQIQYQPSTHYGQSVTQVWESTNLALLTDYERRHTHTQAWLHNIKIQGDFKCFQGLHFFKGFQVPVGTLNIGSWIESTQWH